MMMMILTIRQFHKVSQTVYLKNKYRKKKIIHGFFNLDSESDKYADYRGNCNFILTYLYFLIFIIY